MKNLFTKYIYNDRLIILFKHLTLLKFNLTSKNLILLNNKFIVYQFYT